MGDFKAIRMKDGELVNDFTMKLTMIVNDIHSLTDKVEEISVIKKFLQAVSEIIQIVASIEPSTTLRTCRLRKSTTSRKNINIIWSSSSRYKFSIGMDDYLFKPSTTGHFIK